MTAWDCIVIGAGGVGSAALYHLARRGARVLGLDQFPPAHDRGSSHGVTRIIRQAYFEHADYVPLLLRAYELWADLEHACGERLYRECGLLQIGPPDGEVAPGVLASARQHGLDVERLAASEVTGRWPAFAVPEGHIGVFERRAGMLRVEACVSEHLKLAQQAGAELQTGQRVLGWRRQGADYVVETDKGQYQTRRLVVTAGPWAPALLADFGLRLEVRRKPVFWFADPPAGLRLDSGAPCFLYELAEGIFYGMPGLDDWGLDDGGLKVAEHSGGAVVADPLSVDRNLWPRDQQRVLAFLDQCLPSAGRRVARHDVCMYTMSPDAHFIVDRHPEQEGLVFAAGLSGHGFKFVGVLGSALADLTLDGRTELPIGFLGLAAKGRQ